MSWYDSVKTVTRPILRWPRELVASGRCYEVVKHFESFRRKAYKDTGDVWTAGYGETQGVGPNTVMEHEEALEALERRMEEDFAEAVRGLVEVKLTQGMFDALSSFVYNVGEGQFSESTLLRKLNSEDYEGAAEEFPRWRYDNGEELDGLIRRRACERALFLNEDYQKFMEM